MTYLSKRRDLMARHKELTSKLKTINPTSAASIRDTQEQLARIEQELDAGLEPLRNLTIGSFFVLFFIIILLFLC
jgi:hypothetical protein